MISCVQRSAARALTIPQLKAAGFPPRVFKSPCEPAGPDENARISHEAMMWAHERNKAVLFVEDDIDLAPSFAWHVQRAVTTDCLAYLYLNDTSTRLAHHFGTLTARRIILKKQMPRGPYRVLTVAALFGTQAIVIPQRLVSTFADLVGDKTLVREPFDGRLHRWARAHRGRETVVVMLPHPVQHRQDRTGREPTARVMQSMSFGNAWVGEVPDGELA